MRLIDGDGVNLALIERGQSDKRFKLGDTIRYTPDEVQRIINEDMPTVDAVPVVRCKDCKHRIVNEHYGEKGYIKLKAYCKLDTGDIFSLGKCAEDDDWFCADGERKPTRCKDCKWWDRNSCSIGARGCKEG